MKGTQGIVYVPNRDLVIVASGGDGTLRFVSGQTLAPAGVIRLGDGAGNVRVEQNSGLIAVG